MRFWKFALASVPALILTASSCASIEKPLETDQVRSASAAIGVGQKLCGEGPDRWDATLHSGTWEVKGYFQKGAPGCNWVVVSVRSSDGNSSPCRIVFAPKRVPMSAIGAMQTSGCPGRMTAFDPKRTFLLSLYPIEISVQNRVRAVT